MKILLLIVASLILHSSNLFADDDEISIGYLSVFDAFEQLKKESSANIRQQEGWSIITHEENGCHVVWFFAPEESGVYPAVFKKTILGEETKTLTLCEAPKAKCDSLIKQFKSMNNKDPCMDLTK